MMPAHCFLLTLEAIKWPSEIHQKSHLHCIFRNRCLCLLWSCFWRDFSMDMMPQDPSNWQPVFVAVAALNTRGRRWTWTWVIWSIIERWNLSFLAVLSPNKSKSPQYWYEWNLQGLGYMLVLVRCSLVPRPLPDFISQPWRKPRLQFSASYI